MQITIRQFQLQKMNTLDKKYTDLLQDILDNGVKKEDRTGTGTLSVFGRQIRHKMSEGFPLITTKKMYFKGIVTELLWFLRGDTNIKYLVDNDCHIWDGDCYKKFKNQFDWLGETNHLRPNEFFNDSNEILTKEEFINKIKTDDEFAKKWGDLGPVYGKQWRNWETGFDAFERTEYKSIDQIANLIHDLKTNPDSRRLMVNAWNVGELDSMTLPPCHYGFQVYTRELDIEYRAMLSGEFNENTLRVDQFIEMYGMRLLEQKLDEYNIPKRAISLMWNQRSCDFPLGIPFNIASYGLLLEIIAKAVNMVPDELIGNLGDCHIYSNQIDGVIEQIGRELSIEERVNLANDNDINISFKLGDYNFLEEKLDRLHIPKRTREPYPLPKLIICDDMTRTDSFKVPFDELEYRLIKIFDYQSHPTIKFPLSN
jgi:thymidylate synthase